MIQNDSFSANQTGDVWHVKYNQVLCPWGWYVWWCVREAPMSCAHRRSATSATWRSVTRRSRATCPCGSDVLCSSQVGYFGYVAFCDEEISGDVLMNFRPTLFSESVKMGFVLAVTTSFPLVIFPCRASIHTLLAARVSHRSRPSSACGRSEHCRASVWSLWCCVLQSQQHNQCTLVCMHVGSLRIECIYV